ncbi:type II CRISPR RNA-guided endonuclease Cas9 [Amorphus sp. 3PC139-8]|uniref:type II CRISPR RNA-guided endonuclease Cas9 n=1 Tax=Amorphus sp. 3PC139-8 TaxID=2735676 RepID=UPI00345DCAF1
MSWRLGLDLGTNSIGWCAVELATTGAGERGGTGYRPVGILDLGVRILTPNEEAGRDPQSKQSLAADRRTARAMRRRRDRFQRRQKRLMGLLVHAGLMPASVTDRKALEKLDPYWLRAAALREPLALHEIGRAIFHLNQRRGSKSNRIADAGDGEKGATKEGMKALRAALQEENARTLGELLARRHARDKFGNRLKAGDGHMTPQTVRFRPRTEGAKTLYDFYPSRELVEEELTAIWHAQAPHHPELTDALFNQIRHVVIDQRPLKKPMVGRCTLRPEEELVSPYGFPIDLGERAPKAHPLFQRFRILQDLCQLRVTRAGEAERPLTMQERDAAAARLMAGSGNAVTFDQLRKALKFPDDVRFNVELSGRKGLKPDETGARLAARNAFGKTWRGLSRERQIEVVERMLHTQDAAAMEGWLAEQYRLAPEDAERISEKVRLPQGHGQFGRKVLADLVRVMEEETRDWTDPQTGEIRARPLRYDEAVQAIDEALHHSNLGPERTLARLPYYGEVLPRHVVSKPGAAEGSQEQIGRVPNPTVHIGLNQLRKIVNALIDVYGPPTEIVVELGRELKLNKKGKQKIERENRENEAANDRRRQRLADIGVADTYANRLMLRLYDELPADERVCVYSGEPISIERLFRGDIEVDHILPMSRTLDDSFLNKVLCTRKTNRAKGNRAGRGVVGRRPPRGGGACRAVVSAKGAPVSAGHHGEV